MKRISTIIACSLIIMSCGGKKQTPSLPGQATLVYPDNNAICITGTQLTGDQLGVALVEFRWNSAANTNSYDVYITNLVTGTTSLYPKVNQPTLKATLADNTPYAWYVVSKSSTVSSTAKSEVWRFYNSGPGVISHIPFPAIPQAPTYGRIVTPASGIIPGLNWTGSDVDNDIVGYDIYFGTTTNPPLFKSNVALTSVDNISVTNNTTYYWKVVTRDSKGNTSTSDLYMFQTN